jgi:hypothetical protein
MSADYSPTCPKCGAAQINEKHYTYACFSYPKLALDGDKFVLTGELYQSGNCRTNVLRQQLAARDAELQEARERLDERRDRRYAEFGLAVINEFLAHDCGCDISGADIQKWAVKCSLFRKERYDPKIHGHAGFEDFDEGDEVYLLNDLAGEGKAEA